MIHTTSRNIVLRLAIAIACATAVSTANAAKCSDGGLLFLGKTSDLSKSVWLSRTGAGSFALDASGGVGIVDTWTRDRRALHVSLSPVVSNGSGLPHSLIDTTEGCEIDKVNQKGGIVFPPEIHLPPKLPPLLRPPGGRPLPPGLMPTRPSLPSRPPTGVMPTLPGGVQPPIGTLPPTGLTPTVPTVPPTGVMPTLPGGVQPPIGTLPPTGLTPTVPTVPPTDGLVEREVAITRGREYFIDPALNLWMDSQVTDITDKRFGLDTEGDSINVSIGADGHLGDRVVLGLLTSFEKNRSAGFGNDLLVDSDGVGFGPYMAYALTSQWTLDASFGFTHLDNEERIATLETEYISHRYALTLTATGYYAWDDTRLVPRISIYYSQLVSEEHNLTGAVFGTGVDVAIERTSTNFGTAETTVEFSQGLGGSDAKWYAYVEAGIRYEFERPNDGKILTGDLHQEATSPWIGSARTGVRTLIAQQIFIEAGVGYLSLGQNDLDIVEGSLFVSIAF